MVFISNKFILLGAHLGCHLFCLPPVPKKASELNYLGGTLSKSHEILEFSAGAFNMLAIRL